MHYTHGGYNQEVDHGPDQEKWFEFVEAPAFSRYREDYLDDDEFSALELYLAKNPEAGTQVPGAGGIRKLRWKDARRGKGKRGGLRIIFYTFLSDEEIWLMTLYDKDEADDLTKEQRDQLKTAFEAERASRKLPKATQSQAQGQDQSRKRRGK